MKTETTLAAFLSFFAGLGLAAAAAQEAPKPVPGLEKLGHIIVIYLEPQFRPALRAVPRRRRHRQCRRRGHASRQGWQALRQTAACAEY